MPPAARISDMHVCPLATPGTPPVPHVGGPVVVGQPNVLVAFVPQARVGDQCVCVGPPDAIAMGSPTVLVGGKPAARMGDPTVHGGSIVSGAPNVLIGVAGMGAPPPLSPSMVPPICLVLAQALAENSQAQDMAMLAGAAYGEPDAALPENTRRATPAELEALGLYDTETGVDLTRIEGSNFRSEVFVQTNPETGEDSYVIGFKGTSMTSAEDWDTNARQGLGMQTAYYDQAAEIGRRSSQAAPGRVSFTGHSLGGGLASAASAVSGGSAHTFNAAGLHPNTVEGYDTATVPVQAYYVEGDILSSVQDSTAAPDAVGTRRPLAPARDSVWTDYAGGAVGGVLGAFKGGVWAGAGAAGGHAAARGGRLHMMTSVNEALAAEAEMLLNQAVENGCP